MRQNPSKPKGNMELGKLKRFEMEKNCQKIYDIIVISGKVTTKFIKEYLDSRTEAYNRIIEREAEAEGERRYNHGDFTSTDRENFIKNYINKERKYTISERTIERCLKNDPRIKRNGWYYTVVDEETRFETRYRNPKTFGYYISDEVIYNKGYGFDKTAMEKMLNIFGAITLFVFIEAAKPFKDKFNFKNKKKGFLDRRDYINYWASNAIPLKSMFEAFTLVFTNEVQRKNVEQVKNKNSSKRLDKPDDRPHNEMTDKQSQDCLNMLQSICPKIYNELLSARNKFTEELKSG